MLGNSCHGGTLAKVAGEQLWVLVAAGNLHRPVFLLRSNDQLPVSREQEVGTTTARIRLLCGIRRLAPAAKVQVAFGRLHS